MERTVKLESQPTQAGEETRVGNAKPHVLLWALDNSAILSMNHPQLALLASQHHASEYNRAKFGLHGHCHFLI